MNWQQGRANSAYAPGSGMGSYAPLDPMPRVRSALPGGGAPGFVRGQAEIPGMGSFAPPSSMVPGALGAGGIGSGFMPTEQVTDPYAGSMGTGTWDPRTDPNFDGRTYLSQSAMTPQDNPVTRLNMMASLVHSPWYQDRIHQMVQARRAARRATGPDNGAFVPQVLSPDQPLYSPGNINGPGYVNQYAGGSGVPTPKDNMWSLVNPSLPKR
ncbi:MAG: hypothetical protein IT493_11955 [Gammaproteobacteria bacterium]|nr:hypothetical protein [Gammaproteobacteria bacterium]